MEIHGLDHVEFYAGDASQAAFVLCTAFGFRVLGTGGPETGLADRRSVLVGQGGARVLLTTALSADQPAARFLARHGDGVGVIAFGTDDARGAYEEAVAGGAVAIRAPHVFEYGEHSVTVATVSGFGDVVHRLVERHGPADAAGFLPGAVVPAPAPAGSAAAPGPQQTDLLYAIDHAASWTAPWRTTGGPSGSSRSSRSTSNWAARGCSPRWCRAPRAGSPSP
jgi:4-hydroxymandelate synthase